MGIKSGFLWAALVTQEHLTADREVPGLNLHWELSFLLFSLSLFNISGLSLNRSLGDVQHYWLS